MPHTSENVVQILGLHEFTRVHSCAMGWYLNLSPSSCHSCKWRSFILLCLPDELRINQYLCSTSRRCGHGLHQSTRFPSQIPHFLKLIFIKGPPIFIIWSEKKKLFPPKSFKTENHKRAWFCGCALIWWGCYQNKEMIRAPLHLHSWTQRWT